MNSACLWLWGYFVSREITLFIGIFKYLHHSNNSELVMVYYWKFLLSDGELSMVLSWIDCFFLVVVLVLLNFGTFFIMHASTKSISHCVFPSSTKWRGFFVNTKLWSTSKLPILGAPFPLTMFAVLARLRHAPLPVLGLLVSVFLGTRIICNDRRDQGNLRNSMTFIEIEIACTHYYIYMTDWKHRKHIISQ